MHEAHADVGVRRPPYFQRFPVLLRVQGGTPAAIKGSNWTLGFMRGSVIRNHRPAKE